MLRPTTPEQIALYTAWLNDANAALHQLIVGKKAVTLAYNGETITYQTAEEGALRRHINELSVALGLICRARRPGVRA